MKKIISAILCAALCLTLFASCGGETPKANSDKLQIVTTIFPVYDWIRQIAGDNADVTMLLDSGTDLHSYQPTATDLIKLNDCDLFVYVGGESDEWAEDALGSTENNDRAALNLMELLGENIKEEEVKPGMQAEEEEDEGEEESPEYDEHIWLSLRNAAACCRSIADAMAKIDAENAAIYTANVNIYVEKLNALDAQYQAAVDNAKMKTILFGDRFPFRYMADDYGLDYYAAFVGCSAETEASFETVVFLANKVDELGLHAILQIETSDGSIADTIRQNTQTKDQTILTLSSMQSITSKDVENGADYLKTMQENLPVLTQALQ